jgi:hypothetical protein
MRSYFVYLTLNIIFSVPLWKLKIRVASKKMKWEALYGTCCVGLAQVMLSAFWFNTSWLHCFWRENCHVSDSHWLRPCLNPVRKLPSVIRSWTIQHSTLYLHSILTRKGHGALMHVQYDISRASASLQNIFVQIWRFETSFYTLS